MKTWWYAVLPLVAFQASAQEKPIEIIEVIGRDTSSVVLPSEEDTDGLFGLSESLQEIPRAATVINEYTVKIVFICVRVSRTLYTVEKR